MHTNTEFLLQYMRSVTLNNAPSVVSWQKGLKSSTKDSLFLLQITDASSEQNTATGRPNVSFTNA